MIFLAVSCKQANETEPGDGKRTLQKLKPNWPPNSLAATFCMAELQQQQ